MTAKDTPTKGALLKAALEKKYGTTEPVTLSGATDNDARLSQDLLRGITVDFPSETDAGMKKREQVLERIREQVTKWIEGQSMQLGLTSSDNGKVFTFGSYKLGVVTPESDIDTLIVGPNHVSRESFFSEFAAQIEAMPGCNETVCVPEAYTPVIKTNIDGIDLDLTFARLASQNASQLSNLEDDALLKNVDDKSVRCMNGCRVADMIMALVPHKENYRITLRFIKFWARRRGIYSNVLGFFGGITWALMVARVCQLYPNYVPSQLVNRFFRVYQQWSWKNPVVLCDTIMPEQMPAGLQQMKVWNPKIYPADRNHLMPVITPAFPAMNSTHNVTETTARILQTEFKRGFEMVSNVQAGTLNWEQIYEPFFFWAEYSQFIALEILAKNPDVASKFKGWVESKIRILIKHLEAVKAIQVHPWTRSYPFQHSGDWSQCQGMFIAVQFPKENLMPGQTIDLRPLITEFTEILTAWPEKDFYVGQTQVRVRRLKREMLPGYVQEMVKKEVPLHRKRLQSEISAPPSMKKPKRENTEASEL